MAVRWSARAAESDDPRWPAASGEQWRLTLGEHEAWVVAVGGGVRAYRYGDTPLLAEYSPRSIAPAAAGHTLAPWPNRVRNGRYTWGGHSYQLPIDDPAQDAALHGLVRWLVWSPVQQSQNDITLACHLPPTPGYPWPLYLTTRWTLSTKGLRAEHTAENLGDTPCPFGLGAHPYIDLSRLEPDDAFLQLPASVRRVHNEKGVVIADHPVHETGYDFLQPRSIGRSMFDDTFTSLLSAVDGAAHTRVTNASGSFGVELWQEMPFRWIQVYNGPGPLARAGDALAIEPMTCPPHALHSGEDLITLEPHVTWRASWGIGPYR